MDIKTKRSERGKRVGEEFHPEGKLAYKEMSFRDSDYQMVGVLTTGLDLKLKHCIHLLLKRSTKIN